MALSEVFNLDFKFGGNSEFLARLESLMARVDDRFDSVADGIEDTRKATDELADASRELERSMGSMVGGVDRLSEKFSRLKDNLSMVAAEYLSIRGLQKVWSFGTESMGIFDTQQRAENQLRSVLNNKGDAGSFDRIKAMASDIQSRGIYGDEAMIKAAGELTTFVNGEDSLKSMMALLTDYAAGMTGGGEVSPEQMESLATGLGMAYDGNYRAMKVKGFDTAKLEALDAIVETGGRWGAKEKKKYGDVLDSELVNRIRKQGGVSEDMRVDALKESMDIWSGLYGSLNNLDSSPLIQFKLRLGDLREEIGRRVYPAFNAVVQKLEDHWPAIEAGYNGIADMFVSIADSIAENMDGLMNIVGIFTDILPKVVDLGFTLVNVIDKVIGLKNAFVMLMGVMAAPKVFEFAGAVRKILDEMTVAREKGLDFSSSIMEVSSSMDMAAKAAPLLKAGLAGLTAWAIDKILEFGKAFGAYTEIDSKKVSENKWRNEEFNSDSKMLIDYRRKVKSKRMSEAAYKTEYDKIWKKYAVDGIYGSKDDATLLQNLKNLSPERYAELSAAKTAAKDAKKDSKNVHIKDSFNPTQNVRVEASLEEIGLALNMRFSKMIQSQMALNRSSSIVTEM